MLTQQEIRRATRAKMAGVTRDVAKQNLLASRDVEVAAFMLQGLDMSRFRMEGRSNG